MRDRFLLLPAVLSLALPLSAQSASPGWDSVRRLANGTEIRVSSDRGALNCSFVSADEDSLTCRGAYRPFQRRLMRTFPRTGIRTIKGSRKELSALAGAAIGAGAGAALGAGVDASAKSQEDGHLATAALGLLGALFGSISGSRVDFLAGPLIYKA